MSDKVFKLYSIDEVYYSEDVKIIIEGKEDDRE